MKPLRWSLTFGLMVYIGSDISVQVDFRLLGMKLLKQNYLRLSEHIQLNDIKNLA